MDQTLSKHQRIKRWSELSRLLREGRAVRTDFWTLRWSPNALGYPRLGVITGKRLGSAPARKRWRRLVREAFRRNKALIPKGLDLVVVPQARPKELGYAEVESKWLKMLRKLS